MTRLRRETLLWVVVVLVASCARLSLAFLGIPSFLEMGYCAEANLKENFDPVKYSGLWFDIETVPNEYQHTKKCVTQNYTWTGEQMNVATKGLTDDDERVRQTAIMLQAPTTTNPASFVVQAAGVPEAPYQILATDYRTYSCVYSCLDGYAGFMAEFMWVFSRTPTLPAEKVQLCYDIFESMEVNPKKMVRVVQEEPCPYVEKLDQMLAESERHLLKVLGPADQSEPQPVPVPTQPSAPAPAPTTPPPVIVRDYDLHDNFNTVDDDQEHQKLPRHEEEASRKNLDKPASEKVVVASDGSSVRQTEADDTNNSVTALATPILLFLTLLLSFNLY